jgi:hypothetical protein
VSSPWDDLGEPVGYIVTTMTPLELRFVFCANMLGRPNYRSSRSGKTGDMHKKSWRHNWRNPTFRDDAS